MVFLISPVLWAGFDRAACLSWWLPHWSSFQQEHLTAPSGISVWKAAICEGFLFFFLLKWFYQFWPNKPGWQKGVSVAIAAGADPYAWLECDFFWERCAELCWGRRSLPNIIYFLDLSFLRKRIGGFGSVSRAGPSWCRRDAWWWNLLTFRGNYCIL